jgi:hypothetical protein
MKFKKSFLFILSTVNVGKPGATFALRIVVTNLNA